MLVLQQNKTFWRKAEDNAFLKTNKRAERGAVSVIEFDKCLPLIPLVTRLKTLREVDLVTIAAVQIALYLAEFFAIPGAAHIGRHAEVNVNGSHVGDCCASSHFRRALDIGMAEQRYGLQLVVNNQRPVVNANGHIR